MIASIRMVGTMRRAVDGSRRCAHRRPVRASRNLDQAAALLVDAAARMKRAAEALAKTNQCIAGEADSGLSSMFTQATERWVQVTGWLEEAAADVSALRADVQAGLATGMFVPERPAGRRPRISIAPRPVPVRAFLRLRQPRVVERITPILRRRRRTPRPASVRVPQRSLLGRAPPLFPISVL